jgi:hypothetical protein
MTIRKSLAGGGMKKHAEGYVASETLSTSTGEDNRYLDVTISALPDAAKAYVEFHGSGGNQNGGNVNSGSYYSGLASHVNYVVTSRVFNSTTIRLSTKIIGSSGHAISLAGRYIVWDLS